jgi:hypothetical protein
MNTPLKLIKRLFFKPKEHMCNFPEVFVTPTFDTIDYGTVTHNVNGTYKTEGTRVTFVWLDEFKGD